MHTDMYVAFNLLMRDFKFCYNFFNIIFGQSQLKSVLDMKVEHLLHLDWTPYGFVIIFYKWFILVGLGLD